MTNRPARRTARLAVLAAAAMGATGAAGCGGDDQDRERLHAEQIERAEEAARREERVQQQAKDAAADVRRLQRELERLERRGDTRAASASPPTRGSVPASTPTSGAGTCGGGISINTATTTCGFARNVREAYLASGAAQISAYSPTTGRHHQMQCTSSSPHVCTNASDAYVTFP